MENEIQIINVPEEKITIIREKINDYELDMRFSKIFRISLENKWVNIEDFFNNNKKQFKFNWKDIYVFCLTDYSRDGFEDFLHNRVKKWHRDLKDSDIYVINNDKIIKYEN